MARDCLWSWRNNDTQQYANTRNAREDTKEETIGNRGRETEREREREREIEREGDRATCAVFLTVANASCHYARRAFNFCWGAQCGDVARAVYNAGKCCAAPDRVGGRGVSRRTAQLGAAVGSARGMRLTGVGWGF